MNGKHLKFSLILFSLFVSGCALLGLKDTRVILLNDSKSPFDVAYYSKGQIETETNVKGMYSQLYSTSQNIPNGGIFIVRAQEWKTDKGKFVVEKINLFNAIDSSFIKTSQNGDTLSVKSSFIDKGDWIDRLYAIKIDDNHDSVLVQAHTYVYGLFGIKDTARYSPFYKVYCNGNPNAAK